MLFERADSAWTKQCLRQADCVLLAASAKGNPAERSAVDMQPDALPQRGWVPRRELLLLHESAAAQPYNTAAWLAQHPVAMHHHVRLGRTADFERLARMLTGRAVGLVMSGGGARGGAPIGVIRALREAGVPIDRVGGASVDAWVAAAVAHEFPGQPA